MKPDKVMLSNQSRIGTASGLGIRSQIAVGLHRAGRHHGGQRPQQPAGGAYERLCRARFREDARVARRHQGPGPPVEGLGSGLPLAWTATRPRSWTRFSASCGSSTRRPNRRCPAARSASTSSQTTRPAALRKAGNGESRRLCRCADSIRNPHSPIRTSARRRLRIQGGGAGNPGMLVDMSASWTIRKSAGKTNADTLWN